MTWASPITLVLGAATLHSNTGLAQCAGALAADPPSSASAEQGSARFTLTDGQRA
jgi:hypothetical protein